MVGGRGMSDPKKTKKFKNQKKKKQKKKNKTKQNKTKHRYTDYNLCSTQTTSLKIKICSFVIVCCIFVIFIDRL